MYMHYVLFFITFSCTLLATTAQDYDAMTNIQLGMQGLMQAGSDPAMLAQLMQDMQVRYNQFDGINVVLQLSNSLHVSSLSCSFCIAGS